MAYASDQTPVTAAPRAGIFTRIWNLLIKVGENSARYRTMAELQQKSDAELAQMGLTRKNIAHHVLSTGYYL